MIDTAEINYNTLEIRISLIEEFAAEYDLDLNKFKITIIKSVDSIIQDPGFQISYGSEYTFSNLHPTIRKKIITRVLAFPHILKNPMKLKYQRVLSLDEIKPYFKMWIVEIYKKTNLN